MLIKKPLNILDAKAWQKLRNGNMTKTEASKKLKRERNLWQTVGTINRTLPELLRIAELEVVPNDLPPELVVDYTDCYIVGDLHLPYVNKPALEHLLSNALHDGITTLVLNGDALDFDWCSGYATAYAPATADAVEYHRRAIYDVMHLLAGVFRRIYITHGNHDDRIIRRLDGSLTLKSVWQMYACPASDWVGKNGEQLPNLLNACTITERYYMVMDGSPTGRWRFTHPKNYSKIQGRVAVQLAQYHQCNVVSAHTHHLGEVADGSKRNHYAVDGGCLFDSSKIEYKQVRDELYPKSAVGWVVLRNGVPTIYNWDRIKGGVK